MSLAENLLNSLTEIDYQTSSVEVFSEEPHIVIDESRTITVPVELRNIAVTGDKNVETVTIDCVRYWDGHDLSNFAIYWNYILPYQKNGTYIPTSIRRYDNHFSFDWTIDREMTQFAGTITTSLVAKETDEDGTLLRQWGSFKNNDLNVVEGLGVSDIPDLEEEKDLVSQILSQLNTKLPIGNVVRETGNREDLVMSQGATTRELRPILDALANGRSRIALPIQWEYGHLLASSGAEANDSANRFLRSNYITTPFTILYDTIDRDKIKGLVYKYDKETLAFKSRSVFTDSSFDIYCGNETEVYRLLVKYVDDSTLTDENTAELENSVTPFVGQYSIVSQEEALTVSDCCNSWWCNPRSHYDSLRDTVYIGGITRYGMLGISVFDLRNKKTDFVRLDYRMVDDHNVPAFLIEEDKPPIVAYADHSKYQYVTIKKGNRPYDVKSLETANAVDVSFVKTGETTTERCSYASLIRRPETDTIALITRRGASLWISISTDYGDTWNEPCKFISFPYYGTFKKVDDTLIRYAVAGHPTETLASLYTFDLNPTSGDITGANGALMGNIWDFVTEQSHIKLSLSNVVLEKNETFGLRVFDISERGEVLAMKLPKYDADGNVTTDGTGDFNPELGGMYGVYRKNTDGDWYFDEIIHSGVPVGYNQSSYVGGCCFFRCATNYDGGVAVCRENNGTWYAERYVRNGTNQWGSVNLLQMSNTVKIGRPQLPNGMVNSKRIIALINYHQYSADKYTDYYGDQKIVYF